MKKSFFTGFIACCLMSAVWADNLHIPGNYQESGFGEQREYQKGEANEYIDPFGGGLKRIYTDYVFPNNGGMNINITRFYNTLQNAGSQDDGKWATASGGKAYMGPGWDIHFGRIWLPIESLSDGVGSRVIPALPAEFYQKRNGLPGEMITQWYMDECHISAWTSGGYANQLPVLELPDGSRQVLYPQILVSNNAPGTPI
ncbi:MAG TPA: hypothetical protein VLB90_03320, partial [Pseudomonadales bacterium]|nr:hypothetical protein [Pseudomonadales bacterium]